VVLAGLAVADPMSLVLGCAATGAVAALAYGLDAAGAGIERRLAAATALVLAAGAVLNATSSSAIRPRYVKNVRVDAAATTLERWNSYSQVRMGRLIRGVTQYWGQGSRARPRRADAELYKLTIDGSAATYMQRMSGPDDVANLRDDVTNFGHHLGRRGLACIVGVGGGRDVQSAVLFSYPRVLGIELNSIFIDLLTGDYAAFAGLAGRTDVVLVVDEARSYLTRTDEPCTWIQMSLIDTWAATAAGAFSLSENALYTIEAFRMLYGKLADDGMLSVSRWYHEEQEFETVRLMGLVMTTLLEAGVDEPSSHVLVVRGGNVATVLVSRRPFADDEIATARTVAADSGFAEIHVPGAVASSSLLGEIIAARSLVELNALLDGQPLALLPPTDDNPYFFNMLRLGGIGYALSLEDNNVTGNIKAAAYLLMLVGVLSVLALLTVILPLVARASGSALELVRRPRFRAGAAYFALIGLGFMLVEIALIQRFGVYLGHPINALGVLLFTIILATGVGSLASERLPIASRAVPFVPAAIAAAIGLYVPLTSAVIAHTIMLEWLPRAVITVAMLFPVGLLLGLCFPLGMRMTRSEEAAFTPWFWALNGIMGVLGSCLAVMVSILLGIASSLLLGALCYGLVSVPIRRLRAE
jgi:predicted membrane-bound spermidine synthase